MPNERPITKLIHYSFSLESSLMPGNHIMHGILTYISVYLRRKHLPIVDEAVIGRQIPKDSDSLVGQGAKLPGIQLESP